jgi:hypothetical protein
MQNVSGTVKLVPAERQALKSGFSKTAGGIAMILSRPASRPRLLTRILGVGIQVIVVALAGFALANGAELGPIDPHAGFSIDNLSRQSTLVSTMYLIGDPILLANAQKGDESTAGMYGYKPKSPKRAFAQSLLIPGWGQWYNGSRIKPFVFLGVEAIGWLGVSHFHSQGIKKQDQYQNFADDLTSGWNYTSYQQGLLAVYGVSSDTIPYKNPLWGDSCLTHDCGGISPTIVFSHHIPTDANGNPIKTQTYYENVGKYDQFAFGWRDFKNGEPITNPTDTIGVDFKTPNRNSYLHQRADANREFNRASTALILTISNHLISAFEAALGASHRNKSIDQFGTISAHMRLAQSQIDGTLSPKFYLGYRF